MKRISILIGIMLVSLFQLQGQVPQKFSYQAVLRNADGTVIANQAVNVKISLHKTSATGSVVFTEVHNATTSAQGVVALSIGEGTEQSASFASIPWRDNIFIQVDVKKSTETTYQTMGTSQILSVPYALVAGSVKEVVSQPGASDTDPIFVVKNKEGKIVFAVYQTGVEVYVEDAPGKGARGGFAVGGLTNQKVGSATYLQITPDSARIYMNEPTIVKGTRGGFAVGGLTGAKSTTKDYFKVTKDSSYFSTTVYAQADIITSGNLSTNVGTPSDSIKDADGNYYQTVKIGSQVWMKNNLYTTHYSDGTMLLPDSSRILNNSTNIDTLKKFGRLYAIGVITHTSNVCPTGWHIPTELDWRTLMSFVGSQEWMNNQRPAAQKLMDTASIYWMGAMNLYPNNITGFTARPSGMATISGQTNWLFTADNQKAYWWIKGTVTPPGSIQLNGYDGMIMFTAEAPVDNAYSIRCIKDNLP